MREAVRLHKEAHPNLRERSLSAGYNCVGLIFASRRTWIDAEHLQKILADDGYRRIAISAAVLGDLVLYRDAEGDFAHVGVIVKHNADIETGAWKTLVLSQWGADGEYFHDINDVDSRWLQKSREFWSEKT
jgi:hypothetical protein